MDRVRVLRIVQYEGPRGKVENTIRMSIHGVRKYGDLTITACTVNLFPEVIEEVVLPPDPLLDEDDTRIVEE